MHSPQRFYRSGVNRDPSSGLLSRPALDRAQDRLRIVMLLLPGERREGAAQLARPTGLGQRQSGDVVARAAEGLHASVPQHRLAASLDVADQQRSLTRAGRRADPQRRAVMLQLLQPLKQTRARLEISKRRTRQLGDRSGGRHRREPNPIATPRRSDFPPATLTTRRLPALTAGSAGCSGLGTIASHDADGIDL